MDSVDSNEISDSNAVNNLDSSSEPSVGNSNSNQYSVQSSNELINKIENANDGDIILIEPGTYKVHGVNITKNLTLQGNGAPELIIIDGEYLSSVFLIKNINVTAIFNNLTIIHGKTNHFGGGICIEPGNAYVDNCIFINNTALNETNGGAISNYGIEDDRSYLFVNNSLFLGNHADHDGGAVTTCYARSDIYNSVFVNNSARRDGGAIRVSVYGYGYVQDCIFKYNHADEWAGAYYSWAGNSSIDRCIFTDNTAGTNGGAIMVSGSINVTNNIIVNNTADETGGSFYIQQPMFNDTTIINVIHNYITNNTAPKGQEVYYKWADTEYLHPDFNKNYWGDENPKDPSIIDPDNVSDKSRPTQRIGEPDLFNTLRFDLLDRYSDIIDDYFRGNDDNNQENSSNVNHNDSDSLNKLNPSNDLNPSDNSNGFFNFNNSNKDSTNDNLGNGLLNNTLTKASAGSANTEKSNSTYVSPSSKNNKMVELIEGDSTSMKSFDIRYFAVLAFVLLVFCVGLLKRRDRK